MFFMHFCLDRLSRALALVLGDRSCFGIYPSLWPFLAIVRFLVTWLDFFFLLLVMSLFPYISYGGGGVLTMHSSRGRLRGLGDPSHCAE